MITILDRILTIPEDERFVGFSSDSLHTQKTFLIRDNTQSGWLYRLYLTFDDGSHNFFILPSVITEEGTLLTWNIEESHIFKSGLVSAQIKAFSENKEIYHTTHDVFVAGKSTEEDEEFLNKNSEFLEYEKFLNDLYVKMQNASAKMPYVGENGHWFIYDITKDKYVDSGISSSSGVEDGTITPEKLDRLYWQKNERLSVTGYDYFDSMLNDESASDTIYRVEFSGLSPVKSVVGEGSFIALTSNELLSVFLLNLSNGESWVYEKGSGKLTKCMAESGGLSEGCVTPEHFDREYWEHKSRINVTGYDYFDSMLGEDTATNSIYRVEFSGFSPIKTVVGEGSFIAVTDNNTDSLMLLNVKNGSKWIYAKGSSELVLVSSGDNSVVNLGSLSDVDTLKSVEFENDKLYRFSLTGALAESTGITESDCISTYGYEQGPGGYLRFINLETSKGGFLWINTGGYAENSGTTGADGKSAYEIALANGFEGSEDKWLLSLKGEKGDTGATGPQGPQGEKGDTGKQGPQGEKGEIGADGYTPLKGVDYFTEADKEEFESYITSEFAIRGQLKPEFANDISECTDTSKLYVLPDGIIYAYMTVEAAGGIEEVTEQITGEFTEGSRLSTSSGGLSTLAGAITTPLIDIREYGEVFTIHLNSANGGTADSVKWAATGQTTGNSMCLYKDGSFLLGGFTGASPYSGITYKINSANDVDITFDTASVPSSALGFTHVRFSGVKGNVDTVAVFVTYEKEVTGGTETKWMNTGHAFVPADYESRIVETEAEITTLKKRIATLEANGTNTDIESYVIEEADKVAKEVYSHQNANTFSFLAISDMHEHLSNEQIMISNVHAGQGMDLVREKANINFGVVLGDSGWGSGIVDSDHRATIELGIAEIRSANKKIDKAFRGMPNFRVNGNHDSLLYNYTFNNNDYLDGHELFPLYGAYNMGAMYPDNEKDRGYCYRDFENFKLRVICMNTADIKDFTPADDVSPCYVSGTQQKWLAETLDLSAKSDSVEWGIIIFSHHPLDFGSPIRSCSIIKAYIEGSSISQTYDGVTINYDYAGKNNAKIIANIHGHNHNYLVDNLRYLVDESSTAPLNVKRICIPNACFTRNNERGQNEGVDVFDIEFGESVTYEKIAGTAEDTAFCVVTVDTAQKKIHVSHYGAGYDRIVAYGEAEISPAVE